MSLALWQLTLRIADSTQQLPCRDKESRLSCELTRSVALDVDFIIGIRCVGCELDIDNARLADARWTKCDIEVHLRQLLDEQWQRRHRDREQARVGCTRNRNVHELRMQNRIESKD